MILKDNMMDNRPKRCIAEDVEAVITSFNQRDMILEAVRSLCEQTVLPSRIIIVDDGSKDKTSLEILNKIESDTAIPVPVVVIQQPNSGVSTARNTGIRKSETPFVLVLDGDDKLKPSYIEQVCKLLRENTSMVAASSWMNTFGVLDSVICPTGGDINKFLSRNCCPATHILRHEVWEKSGGYDESMCSGFEDWDFFLSMLETAQNAHIGIVCEPLIDYRTTSASSNIRSMSKRLELMRFIIRKHIQSYKTHVEDAILGIEAISMSRLEGWENEICHTLQEKQIMSQTSKNFIKNPSYGDGGMAAAVRIISSVSWT